MKRIIPILLLSIFIFSACSNQQDELFKKVMAVHDEVMPKMDDIMKYKKQLNAKIDELVAAGQEENEAKITELTQAVEDLENSHEGMMNWMRKFDKNFEGKVKEEVLEYLDDQMSKIEKVGEITNAALKNAEELLAE